MAEFQNFRSALNGFNRQDVVNYIEYINNKHNSQLEQLNTQLQNVREELAQAKAAPVAQGGLQAQLDSALAHCAELEAQLAASQQTVSAPRDTELEAYRRAERAENDSMQQMLRPHLQPILCSSCLGKRT